jgi:hypothetical protein
LPPDAFVYIVSVSIIVFTRSVEEDSNFWISNIKNGEKNYSAKLRKNNYAANHFNGNAFLVF